MTTFQDAVTQTIDWVNEHGTFTVDDVERVLPVASTGDALARWRRVGSVLQEVVKHAFDHDMLLRPDGSRWSLSAIGVPDKLALSLAAHDVLEEVRTTWLSAAYKASLATSGLTPMLVSGSMKVRRLNRFLALRDLAIQTSGASDGQTLAGAMSAGTHGAAVKLGAIHDTVRAIHLMVAPDRALLVQPSSKPLNQPAADALTSWLGFPTELVSDDQCFEAAQVHLGSLGIVLNYVLEVQPLYYLDMVRTAHTDEGEWKDVLATVSAAHLPEHTDDPFHLEILLNPYKPKPGGKPRAWVDTMHKVRFTGQAGVDLSTSFNDRPSPDLIGFISGLAGLLDGSGANPIFRKQITKELIHRYTEGTTTRKAVPGSMFGPTALPREQGHSVEYVVDAAKALQAVEALLGSLQDQLDGGRQYLGALGIRFVGGSKATLAPNAKSPTCFIEMPAIRTPESTTLYDVCGKALRTAGIPFGCHWGQYLTDVPNSLNTYWGAIRKASWIAARKKLLSDKARKVFASPILAPSGLG